MRRRTLPVAVLAAAAVVAGLCLTTPAASASPPAADPANDAGIATAQEHTHGPDSLALDPRGRQVPAATYTVDIELTGDIAGNPYPADALNADGQGSVDASTTLPYFRAVYLYPRDAPNRFATFAAMFQADSRAASAFLATHNGGPKLRWDEKTHNGTSLLDIVPLRSAYRTSQLGSSNQFNLVASEITKKLPQDGRTKWVVWLDAPSRYCGQGNLSQDTLRGDSNTNNNKTVGIVYRPYADDPSTGGFCRGRTLLHEVGHNLGALQSVAPNAFDGAHCSDNKSDVMCYTANSPTDDSTPAFDTGRNDYWDPPASKLSWWTANLNRFLCPSADCTQPNSPTY